MGSPYIPNNLRDLPSRTLTILKGTYGKAAVGDPEFKDKGLPHAFVQKANGKLASVAINELCEVLMSMGVTLKMILDSIFSMIASS